MSGPSPIPELWHWSEFYCPWSYITAVRLNRIAPEFRGQVALRECFFPLEVYGGGMLKRRVYEQEMWLAALQEPEAEFTPYPPDDWPESTLPAFDAAWAARQLDPAAGPDFDLRIRRAFFAQGRNIGRPAVLLELAAEAGLDADAFRRHFESPQARAAVLAEGKQGKERYGVSGTPTLMLPGGEKLDALIVEPEMEDERITGIAALPCCGEDCDQGIRALFERAASEG